MHYARWLTTSALQRVSAAARVPVPRTVDPQVIDEFPGTLVTWAFRSDLACWNTILDTGARILAGKGGLTNTFAYLAKAYRSLVHALSDVEVPADVSGTSPLS